jgi:hypothetical protein
LNWRFEIVILAESGTVSEIGGTAFLHKCKIMSENVIFLLVFMSENVIF